MTSSMPGTLDDRVGNRPVDELADEAQRRLDSLKVITGTSKKTLTTIALLELVDLDPREWIEADLDPGILAVLEQGYTELAEKDPGEDEPPERPEGGPKPSMGYSTDGGES